MVRCRPATVTSAHLGAAPSEEPYRDFDEVRQQQEERGRIILQALCTLLVNQPRAPCGKWMLECVAGMLQKMEGDEDDNFTVVGKAVDELKEEAGLDLAAGKLVKLGTYWPSTGGTRETITYFHCEYPGMVNLVQNAKNNTFGLGAEGEVTKRVVMKVADALKATEDGDAKFQMGYAKLQQMRAAQGS